MKQKTKKNKPTTGSEASFNVPNVEGIGKALDKDIKEAKEKQKQTCRCGVPLSECIAR